jgi:hypothetical protein
MCVEIPKQLYLHCYITGLEYWQLIVIVRSKDQ